MTTRYKFCIEYDGASFSGWQKQVGAITVQETLERAVFELCQEKTFFYGGGRTDKGVHALGQMAHADFKSPKSLDMLRRGLNFHLKRHLIVIIGVEEVPLSFHARFSAVRRSYLYQIVNRPSPLVLDKTRKWWVREPLDLKKLQEIALLFQGHHDFSAFRARDCQSKNPWKTLDVFSVIQNGENIDCFLTARSFLHHQVRLMVGTMIETIRRKQPPSEISRVLQRKVKEPFITTAPAHGLYLRAIDYDA